MIVRAQLIERAVNDTGLDDFGPPGFLDGLDAYLASLESDGGLTRAGADQVAAMLSRRLRNRLEIEAWHRVHPGADAPPRSPAITITGLPRTGTTALANVLSLHPGLRPLRMWEQSCPCPPPVLPHERHDERRVAALEGQRRLAESRPGLEAMHLFEVDATTEDVELIGVDFHGPESTSPAFSYRAWWRDADLGPTYRYHRRVTSLLESARPPDRWLFKAPYHTFHLEAIDAAYPGARFIWTHRDPAKAVPSVASFLGALYLPGARELVGDERIAVDQAEHLRIGIERAIEARERLGDHRFFDVHHRDFLRDPVGVLERLHDWLALDFAGPVRDEMVTWTEANRRGSRGVHRYSARQFGLDPDHLREEYLPYIERFGIELEDT